MRGSGTGHMRTREATLSAQSDVQARIWDNWADHYAADSAGNLPPEDAVKTLTGLSAAGPALELGVGDGRLALPLAAAGIPVTGIDASPRMLDALHARRGSLPVRTVLGDMAEPDLSDGPYQLVYCAASTFFLLLDQNQQTACVHNAARLLTPGGTLVIEAAVPGGPALPLEDHTLVRALGDDFAKVTFALHDRRAQTVQSQEIRFEPDGIRMLPAKKRYAYPGEIDLMARLAGLRRAERWANWRREEFTSHSPHHVTLYR
ncbi:SAM-dependent methyltransferase [Streptomyces griseocarneus]|nr:SAM-dependent methyltransferase [Streptomyces griseocarneus]